jgi:beta-glucosidase
VSRSSPSVPPAAAPDVPTGDARAFPDGFVWGCGTSPTQVDGDTVNEWACVEAKDGTTPDDGAHHWRRYRFDVGRIARCHLGAYRFGFDWGRLQPGPKAEFDRDTALRCLEILAELRSHGIEPFLTLFQFACPVWLAEAGGWTAPEAPELFADFAARLARLTDGEALHWITIHEPVVYAFMAYGLGLFPPAKRLRYDLCLTALKNLRKGHRLAHAAIKDALPSAQVGLVQPLGRFGRLQSRNAADSVSVAMVNRFFDRRELDRFLAYRGSSTADFLVLMDHRALHAAEGNGVATDEGGHRFEAGELVETLRDFDRRAERPLYLCANGLADGDDGTRARFLEAYLAACHDAIQAEVDLRGFFYWSLLDSYEWGEGLGGPGRYGLLEVDFADRKKHRSERGFARVLSRAARTNTLTPAD